MLFLALSMSGKRLAPLLSGRRFFAPISFWKGGLTMVTFTDLIQIGILIVGIISLFQAHKKKQPPQLPSLAVTSQVTHGG